MILLEVIESEFGTINIVQKRDNGAITYMQGGCCQSEADRNGVSLASYIHALYALLMQAKAQNILLIGCGGGTLATMLNRARCKVTIVDVNPMSFALARQYFDLPPTIECHVRDGKSFLKSASQLANRSMIAIPQGVSVRFRPRASRISQLFTAYRGRGAGPDARGRSCIWSSPPESW